MQTSIFMAIKPCCRILFSKKNAGFSRRQAFRRSKFSSFTAMKSSPISTSSSLQQTCQFDTYPYRFLGFQNVINHTRKTSVSPNVNWGQAGVLTSTYHCNGTNRGLYLVPTVVANIRSFSASFDSRTNDNKSEKPLGVEKPGLDEENVTIDDEGKVKVIYDADGQDADKEKEEAVESGDSKKDQSEVDEEAWRLLRNSVVTYCGSPVGTLAANDPGDKQPLNYDQVFVRDFVPSALAFLLKGEAEIIKNFLLHNLQLQSWEKTVDCYSPGQGLMPASFKVRSVPLGENKFEEVLDPDFGESAIGRVAPVDSGLWWIILLRAYGKITGDYSLQERVEFQTGIKLILNLCLSDGFDMFPSLLVTDGSCMIDRRMGVHGHPLEIQALFYSSLRSAREMLTLDEGSKNLVRAVNNRLSALSFHIREYYWVDMKKINEIYRYKTEEYSTEAINKFNIYPEQIPPWLMEWVPEKGGYLVGNLQPANMDFRFFTLGNLWSVISSLSTPRQNEAILNLIEVKWDDLVSEMPVKICYPVIMA